jgi:hypothetical protein
VPLRLFDLAEDMKGYKFSSTKE